jgi:hypothetical protein
MMCERSYLLKQHFFLEVVKAQLRFFVLALAFAGASIRSVTFTGLVGDDFEGWLHNTLFRARFFNFYHFGGHGAEGPCAQGCTRNFENKFSGTLPLQGNWYGLHRISFQKFTYVIPLIKDYFRKNVEFQQLLVHLCYCFSEIL